MRSCKHGLCTRTTVHPLYDCWRNIKRRCYGNYANSKYYKNYGGRGIAVCEEWRNDFNAFYDWAVSNGWERGLTIERINNNGNYEPSNCTWITRKAQLLNRRNNNIIDYCGQKQTLTEWSAQIGINRQTLTKRLRVWQDVERAFTAPISEVHIRVRHSLS